MKGSMELIAHRDPEEASNILDPVLEQMMEAVHHYEGIVSEARGDGIMALFGAPLAHEDHAVRACFAALRMQESVRRVARTIRNSQGIEVQIRVGLNSGEVVVRSIGSDLRMDYSAIGETTHLAARMEQLAAPGTVRLTAETARLAEGAVAVKPLGRVAVKGLSEPVEIYEAIGPGPARTRFQAAASRGFTRFVGRDAEMAQLRGSLEQAGEGRGRIVAVVGEPGVGKSRLLHELTHPHAAESWLVLECGAVSYGEATSYLPVIDLLRAYFHIAGEDDHGAIGEKVAAKLLAGDEALATPLLALLDIPVNGQWQALDPAGRRERTLDAVARLLLRESEQRPLVLVFEDLQWIDAETQALLDGLVERLPTSRLLLLVSYRPEYEQRWGRCAGYAEIRLDPLPAGSAEVLLDGLLGDDASSRPLKQVLMGRAGGNPLFLEECVRSLAEGGGLAGTRGAYRLAHPLESLDVPVTVGAILASRIDRLRPEEKRLLQSAAVIGEKVPFALLREIAENPDTLRSGLAHLKAAEFLYEVNVFPDLEYTFKHALTHDVAYRSVLKERRRAVHAAVVDAIERLHAARLAEHFERLADHALRGELWEKAVRYYHRSARKAGARSAYREAVVCYERALGALRSLPDSPKTLERAIDLRFELNFMLAPLGETSRAIEFLSEAAPLAEALGDQHRLARLLAQTGVCLWAQGSYGRALESGQRALELAVALGDRGSQINARYVLGMVHYTLGDFREAVGMMAGGLRMLEEEPFSVRFRTFYSVSLRVGLALSFGQLGRLAEASESANEALRIAQAAGDSHDLSTAHSALGFVHFQRGEFESAIRILEQGREICERAALAVTLAALAADLGRGYVYSGRADDGAHLIEQTLRRAGAEIQVYAGDWYTYLAEAHLRAGRRDVARGIADRALDLCRARGQRGAEAQCLHLLGDIASSRERPDAEEAEARYREAMARASELGMRPLLARCLISLAKLQQRAGRHATARQHWDAATALGREMGIREIVRPPDTPGRSDE
jgi:class 3 adenylate cyclase/tetratricopeptide (TPR) repeat protein